MKLSKNLQPKFSSKLFRLGKNNDGGYLVGPKSLNKAKVLISYGISDDWSFEKGFLKYNPNILILAYDHTLDFFFLFKRIFINFIKIFLSN